MGASSNNVAIPDYSNEEVLPIAIAIALKEIKDKSVNHNNKPPRLPESTPSSNRRIHTKIFVSFCLGILTATLLVGVLKYNGIILTSANPTTTTITIDNNENELLPSSPSPPPPPPSEPKDNQDYQGEDEYKYYNEYYNEGIIKEDVASNHYHHHDDEEEDEDQEYYYPSSLFTFGVDRPSYCVTSPDSGIYDEPEYFELGMGFTKKRCLVEALHKEFEYVNFWSEDGRCRGLHECPYEYDCSTTTKKPNTTTITVSAMNVRSYTTNNGVGCADSSKSSNSNKNLRLLQGPIGTPCTDTWWDDFSTKFGIGELGGVDGKGPRPNYDCKCWFSKEENRGYIGLLEWGTPNQTNGCNPGWNNPGCGAYQMADILTKKLSIDATVSAVDWWGPSSAFGSDDCPAVAAEINRIMSKIPTAPIATPTSAYVHISDYQGDACFIGDDELYHPSVVDAAKLETVVFCQKLMKDNITPVNVSPVTYLLHGAGIDFTGNGITISTSDGTYCRLSYHVRNGIGDGRWRIVCDLTNDEAAEKFNVASLGNGQFSIQDSTGSYCEMGWGIRCRFRTSVTEYGRFGITASYPPTSNNNCLEYDLSVRTFTVLSSRYEHTKEDMKQLVNKAGDTMYESVIVSKNYPDHSIGTQDNNEVYINKKNGPDLFLIRSGLHGNGGISFESKTFPGRYIRHRDFLCWLETDDGSELFEKDATFLVKEPLVVDDTTGFVSYESINYPGFYLRHQNFRLKLSEGDGSDLFRNDATWKNLNKKYTLPIADVGGVGEGVGSDFEVNNVNASTLATYGLVTSGDCVGPTLVKTVDECKAAIKEVFGVENASVEVWNSPSYAKGCFKHNYGNEGSDLALNAPTRWVFNSNGGPGTSGHCTGEPSYAACICRTELPSKFEVCSNAISAYTPYESDPLKETVIVDFNKALGKDSTTSDPYVAWCILRGCPQFNIKASSWCSSPGAGACTNECDGQCTNYGVPDCGSATPLTIKASLRVNEIPQSPAPYELIVPPPAEFTTRTLNVTLTGNFIGKIFERGNSGVLELLAVQFFDGEDDVTHTVDRVDGTDDTQGGSHIRRPINLVKPYEVVNDPQDPWSQWGPGSSVFDMGPQGQGLWTGIARMTEDGNESETLLFHFDGIQKISRILFYRNDMNNYRERFFRSITVSEI